MASPVADQPGPPGTATTGDGPVLDAVVVGGGLAGIGAAVYLRRQGIERFTVIEKSDGLGGTWHHNTYPGCACDIPSALYSYGFAPRAWSRLFAPQAEILDYLRTTAEAHGVPERTSLNTELLAARWDIDDGCWRIDTNRGRLSSRLLILAVGALHATKTPDFPGLETFEGKVFHTARWPEGYDGSGERVAVIGTGASAIQIVPELQRRARRLTVFQRTPAWIFPKIDWRHSRVERFAIEKIPGVAGLMRAGQWLFAEVFIAATFRPWLSKIFGAIPRLHLRAVVRDREMRRQLTPDYVLGCKRFLNSSHFYPALTRPNVDFVASPVVRVTPHGVVAQDGTRAEVDAIVMATGFHFGVGPVADLVTGRHGLTLTESWKGSPRAYKGTTVAGFPNLAILWGPNGGTASGFVGAEAQLRYIADMIRVMRRADATVVEVLEESEARFKADSDSVTAGSVQNRGGCNNIYVDDNGANQILWPGTMAGMWRTLARFDAEAYTLGPAPPDHEPLLTPVPASEETG